MMSSPAGRVLALGFVSLWILSSCALGSLGTGLPAPAELSATPGESAVTLRWTSVATEPSAVKAYHLYFGVSAQALNQTVAVGGTLTEHEVTGLTNGTTYFFALDVEDASGRHSARSPTVTAVPQGPDDTRPTLLSSSPGAAHTGIALDAALTLTFSEPMDVGSLGVATSPLLTFAAATWDDAHRVATLKPRASLAPNVTYNVSVVAKDSAGNGLVGNTQFSFTTLDPPDQTRPSVTATSPGAGATDVAVGAPISVRFSEPMNTASVEASVSLSGGSCQFGWDAQKTRLTCTHADFASGGNYTFSIGTGALDLAGNSLASVAAVTFHTASSPDSTAPSVTSTSPEGNGVGVSRDGSIQIQFSEAMVFSAVEQAFSCTAGDDDHAVGGSFSWSAGGSRLTFQPEAPWVYGTTVRFQVDVSARDLAGNALAQKLSRSFRVVRRGASVLYAQNANNGGLSDVGSVFDPESKSAPAWVFVGTRSSPNRSYRGFVSFDVSALPANAQVVDATLYVHQKEVHGTPFKAFGPLYAQSVVYGPSLEGADFDVAVVPQGNAEAEVTLSSSADTGQKSAAVGAFVAGDFAHREERGNRTQFRFRFHSDTQAPSADSYVALDLYSGDYAGTDLSRPVLLVAYEYP